MCPKLIFGEKHANKEVIIMRMGSSCPWAFWEPTQRWLLWWTKARENSLILGHLWNILSIVFKARELSRKYFLSVFICNPMLSCSRACLWDLVLILCTFICVKAFCSFLTPNFSEMISWGTSICSTELQGVSHTQLCGTFVEFPYIQGLKNDTGNPDGSFPWF